MWVVIVGGAFGIVTLLVKALIDLGSKSRRQRTAISADIDLLNAVPDDLDAGRELLRRRVERQILEYAGIEDDSRQREGAEDDDREPATREAALGWQQRWLPNFAALSLVLAMSGVISAVLSFSDVGRVVSGISLDSSAVALVAVLGTVIPLLVTRLFELRRQEDADVQLDALRAQVVGARVAFPVSVSDGLRRQVEDLRHEVVDLKRELAERVAREYGKRADDDDDPDGMAGAPVR